MPGVPPDVQSPIGTATAGTQAARDAQAGHPHKPSTRVVQQPVMSGTLPPPSSGAPAFIGDFVASPSPRSSCALFQDAPPPPGSPNALPFVVRCRTPRPLAFSQ